MPKLFQGGEWFLTHLYKPKPFIQVHAISPCENKQKISENVDNLNNTANQISLIEIYKALHPIAAEYISFVSVHGTPPRQTVCWAMQ